jgi:hypothetical protein
MVHAVKQKVGTLLEEDTLRRLKEEAVREQRPMSDIIEEALTSYLNGGARHSSVRLAALERLCSRPFTLTRRQLASLLEEDYYDQ